MLKHLIKRLMNATPYEIRLRLPVPSLDPLGLLLENYEARNYKTTVLQVGACDGMNNDPIRRHVMTSCASAILVEPNPFAFSRLEKSYAGLSNVKLIQAAIGSRNGIADLYRVRRTEKSDSEIDLSLQIASFDRRHPLRHGVNSHDIEQIKVPCKSLGSLVVELGIKKIDLLQIDAEGFDAAIVRMALALPVRPSCINFEHRHLSRADRQPLFHLLRDNGYLLGYDIWNILAVSQH